MYIYLNVLQQCICHEVRIFFFVTPRKWLLYVFNLFPQPVTVCSHYVITNKIGI
ncbi:hypothetical protein RchiOBHm_Chr1g0314101 [Rosa chinensis]|uniref:Uncharacterized protein n=1 Tax=Rosa chinensis TaxID=74649 RepID=A0A2P6S728_ROSCH|nr:hypothetical protein RchiOBHm_Chr1g0314101 [Rosa chinensis]